MYSIYSDKFSKFMPLVLVANEKSMSQMVFKTQKGNISQLPIFFLFVQFCRYESAAIFSLFRPFCLVFSFSHSLSQSYTLLLVLHRSPFFPLLFIRCLSLPIQIKWHDPKKRLIEYGQIPNISQTSLVQIMDVINLE